MLVLVGDGHTTGIGSMKEYLDYYSQLCRVKSLNCKYQHLLIQVLPAAETSLKNHKWLLRLQSITAVSQQRLFRGTCVNRVVVVEPADIHTFD